LEPIELLAPTVIVKGCRATALYRGRASARRGEGTGSYLPPAQAGNRFLHVLRLSHVSERLEVASLIGDVASSPDGKPALHIHAVLGRSDGTARAGHLMEARVRPAEQSVHTAGTISRHWRGSTLREVVRISVANS